MSLWLPAQDAAASRKRWFWLILAVVAVVLGVAAWQPAHDGWRRLHARKLVAEAQAYAAQNRIDQALEAAQAAARRGESSVALLRLLLDLSARSGRPEAFSYWAMLSRQPDLSYDDRRELLRWAITRGQLEAAETQWTELKREEPLPASSMRLAAAYFELRDDAFGAAKFAQEALATDPEDVETRVLLGRVLLKEGSPAEQALGKRLLMEQAQRQDQLGLAVLRHLATSRALLPFEAAECARWLEARGEKAAADQLTLADFQWQARPYRKNEIILEAAESFRGEPAALARWLIGHERFGHVLQILPFERAESSRELAILHLDALAALGRWDELEARLSEGVAVISPLESALYRARAAGELKQPRVAELQWAQARDAAGREARSLLLLATWARTCRAWLVAEEALRALAEQKAFCRRALQGLVGLFEERRDWAGVRTTLAELLEKFPGDPSALNDLAYLQLLEGIEVHSARKTAEELVRARPGYLAFRSTLALAHLRSGDWKGAQALLEGRPVEWSRALPRYRAIYAAVVGNAGDAARARELCREIPVQTLKPEEKELIENWL